MRTKRDPALTRQHLLQAAFDEIHLHGFQAANLDTIPAEAGVTKGALYYHFPTKKALGYAVVDEEVKPLVFNLWLPTLDGAHDPITALVDTLKKFEQRLSSALIERGCPLNNLANEMSPLDEGFRSRLEDIVSQWRENYTQALRRGQKRGQVRNDIDPARSATFIVAAIEGSLGMAKNAKSKEVLHTNFVALTEYLDTLRAAQPDKRRTRPKKRHT